MAFWDRFRKTESNADYPEYYSQVDNVNNGRTWLITIVAFVLTVLVSVGLFFGGRWLYRTLTNKGDTTATVVTDTPTESATPHVNTPTPTPTSTPTPTPTPSATSVPATAIPNTGPEQLED